MNRLAFATLLLTTVAACLPAGEPSTPKTVQIKLNGHTFTLPAGFMIEQVAGPPLVDRPIVADFDEEGRLYVADSSGFSGRADEQLRAKPHRILRLEDTDGDGRFDRHTLFADHMMFPEGCLWYDGSLYVAAPPSIWKLTDKNGNGVAEQREEWFQGKTLTGCANDLHGPYLGPDGWIYWCKGAFARQTYPRPGKKPFVTRAAHIFRSRPDGSGIEPVMTGGMDNPVEVAFTPGGERIFTTTFFQHPGGGYRDGLIHAIYGGVYGKDHDVVYEHPWTSPELMPVLSHFGPAAPAGLTRYASSIFGPEYRDNLFAAQFNMHKVSRHILVPSGATFRARDEDFLVSDNLDFHPTDVLEDADGSLLVVDTGGWYKVCCPSSQLHKPDILGAIYRVRRVGAPHVEDPRGRKLDWTSMTAGHLTGLLDDPRPAVRRRAVQVLGKKGADVVPALGEAIHSGLSVQARRNAVWAATRIDAPAARSFVRQALADPDETVRQAAAHSLSAWRDGEAVPQLLTLLRSSSMPNRRVAAEALGRIGDRRAVPVLLEALAAQTDRVLEHSLTYALIEIGDREGTEAGLQSGNANTRRAALVALDQMDNSRLTPERVAAELTSADPRTRGTASWLITRHPKWGTALAGYLRERLASRNLSGNEQTELVHQLARFARSPAVQALLVDRLRDPSTPLETRRMVLRAMAGAGLKETPAAWNDGLIDILSVSGKMGAELVREAVSTVRALPAPKTPPEGLVTALSHLGQNTAISAEVRLTALAAMPGGLPQVSSSIFTFLATQLDREQPAAQRSLAADVLSKAKLNSQQLIALTEVLRVLSPMEVDRLLEAFAQSADEPVGLALLAALKNAPIRSAVRADALKACLAKFNSHVQHEAEGLYALLNVDAAKQKTQLEQLLGSLHAGDVRRGQAVFNSTKASCSVCHAVGYLGGNVGPDLTRIGKIRTERDLLESIVFPSASFVRSYEPVLVTTKSGKAINGVIRKDSPEELVLATGVNQEARIPRDDVEDVQPSKVSIMPAGFDQQLTVQELADLVAFLKACQ
jgi:putative membrane-bound dehydrogenase-like protein